MTENITSQLDPIFKATSIAFIGASNNKSKWGGMVLNRLLESEYAGEIYPVNPKESEILGKKAYADIRDIPGQVDLAVFTIPAAHMPEVMKNCVEKGVKGGVVISADFAETGETGRQLQNDTVRIAREGGLRFVGPNGNGVWSSAVKMNLSPMPDWIPGSLAFISQSGMFGGAALRASLLQGIGISKFIAMGNQGDLTAADYLEYLVDDDDTQVIAIYLEGMKEGRRFLETAQRVSKKKPIVILKGGCSEQGARATLSHTASIAGTDIVFDAMIRQAGIIRVFQLEHLFIMAAALLKQPLPGGKRVAVVGNGGQSVTTIDNLISLGLEVPEFRPEDKADLKAILPPHAPVPSNPVDFAAGAMETMDEVKVIEKLISMDYIDGVITNVPMNRTYMKTNKDARKQAIVAAVEKFCELPKKYNKPIITQVLMPSELVENILRQAKIPIFNTTEETALAMQGLVKYAEIKGLT